MRVSHFCTLFIKLSFMVVTLVGVLGLTVPIALAASGSISEFRIPTADSFPGDIVKGPDGANWFTEIEGNKIARISTSGQFTEYPLPNGGNPQGLAVGPDNNLWFTETSGNKIGRITTSGQITEYTFPNSTSGPFEITSGSDGKLWFTEVTANTIGRVAPT